ncbi:MAG TPA: hypothetical protein VNZ86_13560, partial [Bacteroidia bacterium]|nr:hypothetical protein [Bacteroidia bacterium]
MNREPKAIGRLTAILGILLANGALMVAGSFEEIQLDLSNPHLLLIAKLSQILGVFLTFILPALLIAIFLTGSGVRYLGLLGKVKPVYFLLALFLILFSMPLIGVLEEWNKHMVLPSSLSGLEAWMRSSEDKAAKLTEAMLKSAGIGDLILNLFIVAFMA